jgi:hypothetical protein
MSDLIAIAYDDLEQARDVTRTIGELQKSHVIELSRQRDPSSAGRMAGSIWVRAGRWRRWARRVERCGAG